MTEEKQTNGKFGFGQRPLGGTDRVIIRDSESMLYGWRTLEALKAKNSGEVPVCVTRDIDIDLFLAYLEAYFSTVPEVRAVLDKPGEIQSVSTAELKAIDAALVLYEEDARALAKIKIDALAGKIPGIDPLDYYQ